MLHPGRIFHLNFFHLLLQAGYFKPSSSAITTLSPCACEYNGHIYNLSSLAKKDGARFKRSAGLYNYAFNPCIPFVQGDAPGCQKVAICYWTSDMHDGIGYQDDVYCQVNRQGIVELIFRQRGPRMGMLSTVQLKCNRSKVLPDVADMNILEDKAEPILEVEHKCCCPDGCPADIPPTLSTPTVYPSTPYPPFTLRTSQYTLSSISTIMLIAVAGATVFIVAYSILIWYCLGRCQRTAAYRGAILPVNFERGAAPPVQREDEDRPPDYGAVGTPLLIPPPPYDDGNDDDDDDDNDNGDDDETGREGVEHEEKPSDPRDDVPVGVPEDGFTNPVQVSERMSK